MGTMKEQISNSKNMQIEKNESTQLQNRKKGVFALLDRYKPQIQAALPRHLSGDRMIRVAITAISKNPKLLQCDEKSLIGAIVQASQLGLEMDGALGHAYLIPYKQTVNFQIGYKGLVALVHRSGDVSSLNFGCVREGDFFKCEFGKNETLSHIPSDAQDRNEKKMTHFYAYSCTKNGGFTFVVMTKSDIDKVRTMSKSPNKGPWVDHYEAMGKKTVIIRLCKLLPQSVELAQAVSLDGQAESGIKQEFNFPIETESEVVNNASNKLTDEEKIEIEKMEKDTEVVS